VKHAKAWRPVASKIFEVWPITAAAAAAAAVVLLLQ